MVYLAVGDLHSPLSTLQKPKGKWEWALLDVANRCWALLLKRMLVQSIKEGTATATWLKTWNLVEQHENPTNEGRIPNKLGCLRNFALDVAYIAPSGPDETPRHFKRALYNDLQQMGTAGRGTGNEGTWVNTDLNWDPVKRNLHTPGVSGVLIRVVYDIPTNVRLVAIHRVEIMPGTRHCISSSNGMCDRNSHLELDIAPDSDEYPKWPRGVSHRMNNIPSLPPLFYTKTQQHWILAHFVWYRTKTQCRQSRADNIDYMRMSRWKEYQRPTRPPNRQLPTSATESTANMNE